MSAAGTKSSFWDLPWTPLYTQVPVSLSDNSSASNNVFEYWSLAATIAFTVTVYSLETYLDGRQRKAYQNTQFPLQLEKTVTAVDKERAIAAAAAKKKKEEDETTDKKSEEEEEDSDSLNSNKPLLPQLQSKFRNAQAYGLDKIQFGMIAAAYDVVESVVFLLAGFLPYLWDASVRTGQVYFGWTEKTHEISISLIFLAYVTVIGTITSLPFEIYSTFYIERKHGFNKQTPGLFVSDKIKSLLLTAVIGGPFTALLLYIIRAGGTYFYLYVWAFLFVFSVFMMTIVPVVIMPLFNKYEPLPDGTLKTRIYQLAARLQYPLTKLFVMDGSKRSSHSNAFMFGFGNNKRIVLFDTLLTQVTEDEILAILGHELGHWKCGHTLTNFVVTQAYFGAAFYAFACLYQNDALYQAFGFNDPARQPVPTIIALLLFFQTIWAPVDKVLSFVLTVFSRHNEFQADRFSMELGYSQKLQSGLCKIHLENLGAMCPDWLYSTYHYSHPPLVERLSAMMKLDQELAASKSKKE